MLQLNDANVLYVCDIAAMILLIIPQPHHQCQYDDMRHYVQILKPIAVKLEFTKDDPQTVPHVTKVDPVKGPHVFVLGGG